MVLNVYNTLSREVEEFKPIDEGVVNVYICGLTVYDYMHIGHARTYLAFDVILRYLRYRGYKLNYVQNITDIDDKIVKRAREKNVEPLELSSEFAKESSEDQASLGLIRADEYPKVSENIGDIIKAVQKLVTSGHAYEVGGNVYFDVSSFQDYGRLSNQDTEQLNRHRIEPAPGKKTSLDFSLWKKSADKFGFDSPWGYGRPGWHIECSVMSQKYLADQIDIHGGAMDLIFPHHENEIAQSESLTGKKPFVRYWMHTGFLNSSGEKMSKSLGNILPVREFIKKHSPQAFRLFILQTHYRSPIDYSEENVVSAENALKRLRTFKRELNSALEKATDDGGEKAKDVAAALREEFTSLMDDDFRTPSAVGALFDAVRKINSILSDGGESKHSLEYTVNLFDELFDVLGLEVASTDEEFSGEVMELIEKRNKYRQEKNWGQADKIRQQLLDKGVRLIDRQDGTTVAERT